MNRAIAGTLLLLFALVFSSLALAMGKDARVAFVRGTVTATDKSINVPRLLQRDSRVEVGEVIDTGPKGLVQLVFPDSSMLYIKANSSIKLEAFHFSPDEPEKDAAVTEVIKGSMRALTGIVGKRSKDKVQFKTRVSTVGIRGTAIEIWQDGDAVTVDFGDVVVENAAGEVNLGEGQSAKTVSSQKVALAFEFQRPSSDAAVLARDLVEAAPDEVVAKSGEVCKQLSTEEALFLMGIQGQVPGFTPRVATATIEGLTICFPIDQMALLLTTSVMIYPDEAPAFLRTAADSDVDVAIALEAVLRGMEDPSKEQLNTLFNSAADLGLTPEQAKQVVQNIKDTGICR
ncbi:MAG: FecR domain-containing protein [Gammaproteobacteria bacterium]|jgi:hypothetical protein